MFAIAFLSSLDPTEKERDIVNDGWCIESTVSSTACLDERAEMAALVKETTVDDGGCVWMAPNAPPIALSVAVVAGSAAAGGF